ncbi:3-oxoadipate enol-lactonase [Pseudoduganella flava]|uniref:3-oxoadipate enol-lactonase n=1 Tax=Pseudoduganella flava TaxID=871742 RepID=A0A562PLE2_9BURK|nr:alpha/beta fold hydrolase [Pseudoduganella flava]QGZ42450.1 alpha/beta fold hydrolase [Pseudoduganella flava]TWI45020.1 3-oxoadipate enol-lactonase [Pseudoduganella flava]
MTYDPFQHDFERGLRNRRRILGDEWVDRSLDNATDFNAEFQNLITRFAWNEIWGRPGLEAKTRRAIVLAITIALGRWEEFELHVRAALLGGEQGMAPDEVKEVLMQSAIYAGVPAANTAFAHTQKILREIGERIGYAPAAAAPAQAVHPGVGRTGRTGSRPALHYSVREPRHGGAPRHTIVLSHALGMDLSMWDDLANELALECRVIAYDHRGHGGSDAPDGPYDMAALADDAARLLLELATGPVIWIGLSMGGMVGQELALRHPKMVRALVIANSTSGYPEAAREGWRQRVATVREHGLEAIADTVMARYFHPAFRAAQAATVARWRRRLTSTDPAGYVTCCDAVGNVDTTARLPGIVVPTLVIAGALDQGAPVAMSETIANAIPGARLVVLAEASHIAAVEQPVAFSRAVREFLAGL